MTHRDSKERKSIRMAACNRTFRQPKYNDEKSLQQFREKPYQLQYLEKLQAFNKKKQVESSDTSDITVMTREEAVAAFERDAYKCECCSNYECPRWAMSGANGELIEFDCAAITDGYVDIEQYCHDNEIKMIEH